MLLQDITSLFKSLVTNETGLTIALNQNLDHSHRHQNHLLAIHPMGLLNIEDSCAKDYY